MIPFAAATAGVLVACGVYLLLSRNTQRLVMGFLLVSNGTNLFVLTLAGLPAGASPPIVGEAGAPHADPLPQAFILTAIVIGLGTAAFLLALAVRLHRELGSDDLPGGAP